VDKRNLKETLLSQAKGASAQSSVYEYAELSKVCLYSFY